MLVEEAIPDKKVVWKCIDTLIDIAEHKNKREWIGTKIVWEILPEINGTKIVVQSDKASQGYDPVAYFTKSKPVKGNEKLVYNWKNTKWYFS